MKTISIFLALVNSLLAGLLIAYGMSETELQQAEVWWALIKIIASLMVIAFGVITWFASMWNTNTYIVSLGGVFLVVLGTVTVVWTFHLAILSGDMEYYMIVYGLGLMVQGMASLLGFGGESRNMTAT